MNDLDTSTALTERARTLAANVIGTSRRGLMCGALGVSATAVLAACGGDDSAEDGDKGGSGDDKSKDSGGESGEVLAKESEIPEGGGKIVDDVIVVQPKQGEYAAFSTVCPHKQLPKLQEPDSSGTIVCAAHGSKFKIDGTLAGGPAQKGLTTVKVKVEKGEIVRA